jgi:ATP-dependent Clp protease protease subunit
MSMDKIVTETDRDNYMSPSQAIELGIIDSIIEPKK